MDVERARNMYEVVNEPTPRSQDRAIVPVGSPVDVPSPASPIAPSRFEQGIGLFGLDLGALTLLCSLVYGLAFAALEERESSSDEEQSVYQMV